MFLMVILRHPDLQVKTQEEPKSIVMQPKYSLAHAFGGVAQ